MEIALVNYRRDISNLSFLKAPSTIRDSLAGSRPDHTNRTFFDGFNEIDGIKPAHENEDGGLKRSIKEDIACFIEFDSLGGQVFEGVSQPRQGLQLAGRIPELLQAGDRNPL